MPKRPSREPAKRRPQVRLAPEARRRQLLDGAARILTESGVEAVEISAVAEACGVTRPIVYRFFATREALVLAVLEDFTEALDAAYRGALERTAGHPLNDVTRAFALASCEVIEAKGAGPWRLLDARVMGSAIGRAGIDLIDRLFSPWFAHISKLTGRSETELAMQVASLVAVGRSSFDFWIDGVVSRDVAVEHASRNLRVLLEEFGRVAR